MFAVLASVTYQRHCLCTPLFHISALIGSPNAMVTLVHRATVRQRFGFVPGAALAAATIHRMTGAALGIVFALMARRVPRRLVVGPGMLYGLAVSIWPSFVGPPAAASLTGTGTIISEMPGTIGSATFAVARLLLGLTPVVVAPTAAAVPRPGPRV